MFYYWSEQLKCCNVTKSFYNQCFYLIQKQLISSWLTLKVTGYHKILDARMIFHWILFSGTLMPGMTERYCVMLYLHESQRYTNFIIQINDVHVINFKLLLAKNLTVQVLCVVSYIPDLWLTIPSRNWQKILTTGWFFCFVLIKPGTRILSAAWFLEIASVGTSVCVWVCVSVPEGINNQ